MQLDRNLKVFALVVAASLMAACATSATQNSSTPDSTSAAKDTQAADAKAMNGGETYMVVRGDHLWGISAKSKIYGNPYMWPLIYRANAGSIQDADVIQPGQKLAIDRNYTASDKSAAEHHARTRGEWSIGKTEASDKAYLKK